MLGDGQLLQQYTQERSESAFGELVLRHVDLVYSAALRVAGGDRHLAQDVTQGVFMDLARKAWRLPRDVLLAGWLHRHACYLAANAVRTERRRRTREQTAMEMRALDDNTEPPWERIAPHLDEGLNQLSAADRDALVLRFLKRQDLRTVGAALGISEDAAQKRVSRALEKLRGVLSRRGVALTATSLASVLTVEAVTAAPAGLAISATAASLAAAAGTGTILTLLKLMASTKLKTGIISAIVVASVVTPLVVQHQAQARLHDQARALRQGAEQLAEIQAENKRLKSRLARAIGSRSPPKDQLSELMRLRGEVGRLRTDARELSQPKTPAPMSRTDMLASMAEFYSERVNQLKQLLDTNPAEQIPELQFVTESEWLWLAHDSHLATEAGYRMAMSKSRSMAEGHIFHDVLRPALQQYAQENNGQFPMDIAQLKPWFKSPVDEAILQRWVVLPKSKLAPDLQAQLKEDWFITQKAPVNAALDQRYLGGLNEVHLFADGPPHWWTLR
jgi:RNA polymerase sigma factor (sigma-70 family)